MSTRTLSRILLTAAAVISPAVAIAAPQDYRPDAEGYPCQSASRLAVTQDAQGFVIRKQTRPAAPVTPTRVEPPLQIGANLKFDLAIFKRMAKQREADDASCC